MKIKANKNVPWIPCSAGKESYTAKGGCTLPEKLINKDNVFLDFYTKPHEVEVRFSVNIEKEFASWPEKKVKCLIDDIYKELNNFFIDVPWSNIAMEMIYQVIFARLRRPI